MSVFPRRIIPPLSLATPKKGSSGKGAQPASIDPGGVPAVSRWLSAATPPVLWPNAASTPIGVAAVSIEILRILVHSERRRGYHPRPGSFRLSATATGGVAALNHRLMATTPSGVMVRHLPDEPKKRQRHHGRDGTPAASRSAEGPPHRKSVATLFCVSHRARLRVYCAGPTLPAHREGYPCRTVIATTVTPTVRPSSPKLRSRCRAGCAVLAPRR